MGNIQYTVPVCILVEKESRQSVWWEAKLLGDFLLGEINIFVRKEIVVVAAETAQEKFFLSFSVVGGIYGVCPKSNLNM